MLLPNNGRIFDYPIVNNISNLIFSRCFKNYDINLNGAGPFKCNNNLSLFNESSFINLDLNYESKINNNIDSSSENNLIAEENKSNIIFGNFNGSGDPKVISSKTDDIIEHTNIESTRDLNIYINNDPSLNVSSSSSDYSNNTESTNNVNHNTESTNNVNHNTESTNTDNHNTESTNTDNHNTEFINTDNHNIESMNNIQSYLSKKNKKIKGNVDNLCMEQNLEYKILGSKNILVNLDIVNDNIVSILGKELKNPINFIFLKNDEDLEVVDSNNNILLQNLKIFKEKQNLKYKFLMKYIYKHDFIIIMNLFNGLTNPDVPFELKEERNIIINKIQNFLKNFLLQSEAKIKKKCLNNTHFNNSIELFMYQDSGAKYYIKARLDNDTPFIDDNIPDSVQIDILVTCDLHLQFQLMTQIVEDSFKKIYNNN
jgi:hypothetical protein